MYTPVELYLSFRNQFRKVCLLESNDYHSRQNSKSFIGLDPIVEVRMDKDEIMLTIEGKREARTINQDVSLSEQLQNVLNEFSFDSKDNNGFFGRFSFEFNHKEETHHDELPSNLDLPIAHFFLFRHLIVLDHFSDSGYILENNFNSDFEGRTIDELLRGTDKQPLPFQLLGDERAMLMDAEVKANIEAAVEHCHNGEVFQLVLSNEFERDFFGDEFQVYRELRRLNPSPYLFYFDFEEYRLFGSSPEAQFVVRDGKAEIHPIAGTVPKAGDKNLDKKSLDYLMNSEKENAEHAMLVDLARNDLSRDCDEVQIESYKEIQHFSHVIHLVSKVTGKLSNDNCIPAMINSFPAGTLSGTPKPRALELIREMEPKSREFYGGSIGFIGANGDLNTAIVIRSMLSRNGTLYYRAGAGIVVDSEPDREVQEIDHKLGAVRRAIELTQRVHSPQNKEV